MTDEQIIKALECCIYDRVGCTECPLFGDGSPNCWEAMRKNALDLIKRKDAEIEKKQSAYELCKQEYDSMFNANRNLLAEVERLKEEIEKAKSEAYREFAERLKDVPSIIIAGQKHYVIVETYFDNTLKELTRNLHGTCTESTDQTATNQSVSLIDGHIEE